jgi:hypothetical protein
MAGAVAKAVIGGVLIKVVKGWIIKDLRDDRRKIFLLLNEKKAVMDDLGRNWTDDVYTEHSERTTFKNKL